ncbi:phage major capsid protein [Acuticoccus sp. I52.16.1]|uniref:phage major capsid protein n=1 Tax=Acuticoccus sp. I52.16.1 TaxID=2928472 RepID=UPI001FD00327|nr:phage major capsid protein [Acuticoccus sp. I52.16.1]UOM34861.1 phage major capsid protein [Acuticoccus sp. I52.16.1]
MLESVKISRRQSEIRQNLAELVGKETTNEAELRSMETLDTEYRNNEVRYRAALVSEDTERREAGAELETREGRQFADLVGAFEVRQVVAALDHGHQISGQTAEVIQEMRAQGAYTGMPIPLEALEVRNTVSGDLVEPKQTRGIFDRLFPTSVASRLGVSSVNIDHGTVEYPIATQGAVAGWAASEGADVTGPTAFQTTEATLSPDHTLGARMAVSRKSLKQVGGGLETAIRRDMAAAIGAELDRAILVGSGASGQPTGIVTAALNTGTWADYWSTVKAEIVEFMDANAISDPGQVRMAMTPAMWSALDDAVWDAGSGITEWDRLARHIGAGNIARATQLTAGTAVLTVTAGGLAPAYLGMWGGVDLIRDPYSDAASGGLRLTGLLTVDLAVPRQEQVRVLEPGS